MKQFLQSNFVLLLTLLVPTMLYASPYTGRMSSVYGEAKVVPSFNPYSLKTLGQGENPNVRFNAYVSGLGRLSFVFQEERALESLPMIDTGNGMIPDGGTITLLRGSVQGAHFTSPVAGSILSEDGRLTATAAFEAPRRLTGRVSFYRLSFPLDNPSDVTIQKVTGGMGLNTCGTHEHSHQHHPRLQPLAASPVTTQNFKELQLALDGDQSWGQAFGSGGTAKISQLVGEAEMKYEEQLSVTFAITRLVVNSSNPIGSSDANNKLTTYQNLSNAASHFGTFDVAHLFTATNLNGGTIGLAFVGVICDFPTASYGINQFTNDAVTAVTFAHELGHNFNADHSAGGIMAAVATNEGLDSLSFTNESLNQMVPFINGASCLSTVDGGGSDPDPTPTPTPTPDPGGGGGGGGSGGGDENFVDLSFDASLNSAGQYSLSVQASETISGDDDCFLDFVHAGSRSRIGRGRIFATIPFSGTSFSTSGTIASRARGRNRKGNRIKYFLAAELFCNNNTDTFGFSAARQVKAQGIRVRSRRLGPKRWFDALGGLVEDSQ